MSTEILYFGCLDEAGHYLFSKVNPGIRTRDQPWGLNIDSEAVGHCGRGTPGICVTTRKDGWTAVDFTDNSVDSRPGSHSCFLAHACLSANELLELARDQWPEVFSRRGFPSLTHQL